jgi:hypothetical protein
MDQALQDVVGGDNLELVEVPGDGNCQPGEVGGSGSNRMALGVSRKRTNDEPGDGGHGEGAGPSAPKKAALLSPSGNGWMSNNRADDDPTAEEGVRFENDGGLELARPNYPQLLLRAIEESGSTTWDGFLSSSTTGPQTWKDGDRLQENYGELVALAAVDYFEEVEAAELGAPSHALLDPNKLPMLDWEGDWDKISGSRPWLKACRQGNKPFETFDGILYRPSGVRASIPVLMQAKWQDGSGGEFKQWFNLDATSGKRVRQALDETIAVYYVTPGGNPTLDASLLEKFEELGGKVLNADSLSEPTNAEDFMEHLKRLLKVWGGTTGAEPTGSPTVPAKPKPRGVQLAALNRVRPLFMRGGVRSDYVLGTGSGKTITGTCLIAQGKKTVVFVDGHTMVPQMMDALRKSGLVPSDVRYWWICSSFNEYPKCTKIGCSRRTLRALMGTDAENDGSAEGGRHHNNDKRNADVGQINLDGPPRVSMTSRS